jgi:signal transduction histidine kinase
MRVQSGPSGLLLETFTNAAQSDDPGRALSELMRDCVAQTGAARGDLYLLDLSHNSFVLDCSTSEPSSVSSISLHSNDRPRMDLVVKRVLETRQPVCVDGIKANRAFEVLLVPICRENACLGLIRLTANDSFQEGAVSTAQLVAQIAAFLLEKRYALRLLTVLEKPINYNQSRDGFLDHLMLIAADASGFPYIVLRELDKDGSSLECIRSFGFSNLTPADLHLAPLSDYPSFEAAIVGRGTRILESLPKSGTPVGALAESEGLERVVVVPVIVGADVFGTASFSIACDHNITRLEQRGLEAIANFIGGAIANYRNVGLAHEVFFERAKAAAAFTTVDVAQAARHEARNYVHNAQTNMLTLSKMVGKSSSSKGKPDITSLIDDVFNDLGNIDIALDKIKAITKPLDHAREAYELSRLWQEAFDLVGGRLHAMNVRYTIRGSVLVDCIPDLLRHGFLQLVLNSIDSFKASGKKRGHAITVTIERPNDDQVFMRYSDNGMGLDIAGLMGKDFQGTPKVTDIFLPGVTTKEGGSGYGLYLVRRALAEHHGSIDLCDYRNGMSFDMVLTRRPAREI